jgi:hypothetical protein
MVVVGNVITGPVEVCALIAKEPRRKNARREIDCFIRMETVLS